MVHIPLNTFDDSVKDDQPKATKTEIETSIRAAISERKRAERSDKGKPRPVYKPSLPPKYRQYLNRANKKGFAFELSIAEFDHVLSLNCVYCGSSSRITVDRRDNSIGYSKENVQPCCYLCNIMKYTHSEEAFLKHIKRIYDNNFLH